MNSEYDDIDTLVAELDELRARESDILSRMHAILDRSAESRPAHFKRVFALAKEAFAEDVIEFLVAPHRELHDQKPILLAQDEEGAKCVEELLYRILYGIPV